MPINVTTGTVSRSDVSRGWIAASYRKSYNNNNNRDRVSRLPFYRLEESEWGRRDDAKTKRHVSMRTGGASFPVEKIGRAEVAAGSVLFPSSPICMANRTGGRGPSYERADV